MRRPSQHHGKNAYLVFVELMNMEAIVIKYYAHLFLL